MVLSTASHETFSCDMVLLFTSKGIYIGTSSFSSVVPMKVSLLLQSCT